MVRCCKCYDAIDLSSACYIATSIVVLGRTLWLPGVLYHEIPATAITDPDVSKSRGRGIVDAHHAQR